MEHKVQANWQGEMQFMADAPGGIVHLDAAEEFGGKNKGNRSKSLMLVALAGCTGMDVVSLIRKMRLNVDGFTVEVTAQLSEEHPKMYTQTHVSYSFSGTELDQEKLEKAVDLSFDTYCGVIAMFKTFSTVTKEIRYNS